MNFCNLKKPCCCCCIGPTGPTGPSGKNGTADEITIGNTITTGPGTVAQVVDRTGSPNHILDFLIPMGEHGKGLEILGTVDDVLDLPNDAKNGDAYLVGAIEPRTLYIYDIALETWLDHGAIQGPQGEDGEKGEKGEKGDDGLNGIDGIDGVDGTTPTIGDNGNWFLGTEDTGKPSRGEKGEKGDKGIDGLNGIDGEDGIDGTDGIDGANGTTPTIGDNGNWFLGTEDTGKPSRGEKGEKGDNGSEKIKEAYFVTLNDVDNTVPVNGLEVASGARLPIKRKEVDTANLFVLDSNDNTIQFNSLGTYEVIFTTNAYVQKTGTDFDASTDFVSIGFRAVDSEIIFAGANTWSAENVAINTVGIGIFEVTSIAEPFEIVNLQKKPMFINGGKINQTITHSYFSCPIVSILIKKLN